MTREIRLTRDLVALVDESDYDFLSQWKWYAATDGKRTYAKRGVTLRGTPNRQVWMHRQITGCPDGWIVDHANGNGLDNRKENLRFCTPGLNNVNMVRPRARSPFRGVHHRNGSYQVNIKIDGKTVNFGSYRDPVFAAMHYDEVALLHYGEFAVLNFPH